MAIVETTIIPLGTGSTSLSTYVAACHKILKEDSRIKYQLTPMGTILEGDLGVILEIIRKMHEVPFENGAMRVNTSIRIDDRRDIEASMDQKLKSVKEKLWKENNNIINLNIAFNTLRNSFLLDYKNWNPFALVALRCWFLIKPIKFYYIFLI